jgi:tetratricopeptide (TPR) repeat protein
MASRARVLAPVTRLAVLLLAIVPLSAQSTAEKLIAEGHWKRARTIVEATTHGNPQDALSCFLMSQIKAAFGDRQAPLPLAEKAVALDARTAKYHRQVAEVIGMMAESSGAFSQFLMAHRFSREIHLALELDGKDLQAWRDLEEFYLLAPAIAGGSRNDARNTAHTIARLDPVAGFLAEARLAEAEKLPEKARERYRRAVEAAPSNYHALIALAQFDLGRGHENLDEAAREAAEAVRIDGARAEAYAVLAEVFAARSDWTNLDHVLESAERTAPDDFLPFYRAGERLLAAASDLRRAESYFRKYLSQDPEGNTPSHAEAHWKLGQVLAKLSRPVDALAEWREAARLDPDSPARAELRRTARIE